MQCAKPTPAWTLLDGRQTKTPPNSYVPPDSRWACGKCGLCIRRKKRDWAFRIMHEMQMHEENAFVTLTYDEENEPEKLQKEDMQLFFKRLRHNYGPIRYFYCGEYGPKTNRPHYHAIIFGTNFTDILDTNSATNRYHNAPNPASSMHGRSRILDSIWQKGYTHAVPASPGSAVYTAGYVEKKIDDDNTISGMSKKPPIGKTWLLKYKDNLKNGYLNYRSQSGKINRVSIPLVYRKWIKDIDPELYQELKDVTDDYKEETEWLTDQQLDSRELAYKLNQKRFNSEKI